MIDRDETALEVGAEQFAAVLRAATEYSIIGTDADGIITVFNEGAERMLGYRAEELVGRHTPELFHDPGEIAARAAELGISPGFEVFVMAAREGRAETREWTYRRKDGTPVAVSLTVTAMVDRAGRTTGFIGIAQDIGERKRAEAEQARLLRQTESAEAMFRGLLESAPDAIVIARADGRILLLNREAERMFGYARAELIDQPIERLMPDELRASHVAHRAGYMAQPRTRPMGSGLELRGRRKDGRVFPVEISLSPVESAEGVLVMSVIRDITDRRNLERQKDEFLASVSHDLRTPLAGIKASIGVVLANEPPGIPEPLHRMLVNIDQSADRMGQLVADLLEMTRLQAGRVLLRPVEMDLREVVARAGRAIEPLAEGRRQRVQLEIPPEPVRAYADAERLERALLNLLSNAHKYGREGGSIRVSLERRPETVVISVVDDGPGIPLSEQERIFERFYRSETEATRRNQGSGLGLPIARAMVALHGGRLWVESAPGQGATFRIALPIAPALFGAGEEHGP